MNNDQQDEKIAELEERIKKLESTLAFHYHDEMSSACIGHSAAVWFESMGPYRK